MSSPSNHSNTSTHSPRASRRDADVLIVGAGPTGLVLALWLTTLGVRVRIIDKTAEPGTTSRALAVQARTLELYRQVGLADAVVAAGRKMAAVNLWAAGTQVAHAVLGDMGRDISPFPYVLIFPQDEEPERIAFARRLVATTDQAFTGVTSDGTIARRLRLNVAPVVIPWLFSFGLTRRFMFRTVSQTGVNYRDSSLSEGHAGRVHGGDRLPWVMPSVLGGANDVDNFTPLTSLDWQVHVYGEATPEMQAVCQARTLPLHVFPWRPEIGRTGLQRDAVYLVRPDGYIALADSEGGAAAIAAYLDARHITAPASTPTPETR